jgi:hypothetical protein
MFSRQMVIPSSRWLVALVMAIIAVSCESMSGPRPLPIGRLVASADTSDYTRLKAGSRVRLAADVLGQDEKPLGGAEVHWRVSPGAGRLDSLTSITQFDGRARVGFDVTTVPGSYRVGASVDTFVYDITITVVAGDLFRIEGVPDSVRFTRLGQTVKRPIRGYDRYGNAVTDLGGRWLADTTTGPVTAEIDFRYNYPPGTPDTLIIRASGEAPGTGDAMLFTQERGAGPRVPFARAKVVFDPIIAAVKLIGGIDSLGGVAVGESSRFVVHVADSAGTLFQNPDVASLGVTFSSSDPSVADVTAQGIVRGIRTGTAQITAQREGSRLSVRVPVIPAIDIGSLKQVVFAPYPDSHTSVGVELDSLGNSLLVVNRGGGSQGAVVTEAVWYDAAGTRRWSRTFTSVGVRLGNDGAIYVWGRDELISIDSSGRERWRQQVPMESTGLNAFAPGSSGLYVAQTKSLRAFATDGSLLWTRSFDGLRAIVPAPTRIFAWTVELNGASPKLVALDLQGRDVGSLVDPGLGLVITDDASMLYGLVAGELWAIDASGAVRWKRPGVGYGTYAPGPYGTVIFTSPNRVEAVDRESGRTLWAAQTPLQFARPHRVNDNVYLSGTFIFGYDGATGRLLGKTTAPLTTYPDEMRCTPAGLMITGFHNVYRADRCG